MFVSDKKSELRTILLKKRISMSDNEWTLKSAAIIENLNKLSEFKSASVIHTYVSMDERKEVDTHNLILNLLTAEIKVIVPVTDFKSDELKHSELTSYDNLKLNKWGVLEPSSINSYKGNINLILVPLLAGDEQFNRLGYGKGYYDRFLKTTNAKKIGLLFDEFLLNEIPTDDFDEKLDILITDKMILRRNNR
jgi:5-formyltetrahydrofolate cyclo-ligase